MKRCDKMQEEITKRGRPRTPMEDDEAAKAVFDFIVTFKRLQDGNSPTMTEIRKATNTTNVSAILKRLEENGYIMKNDRTHKRIVVIGGAWSFGGWL